MVSRRDNLETWLWRGIKFGDYALLRGLPIFGCRAKSKRNLRKLCKLRPWEDMEPIIWAVMPG